MIFLIDERTPHGFLLPNKRNYADEDVGRMRQSFIAIDASLTQHERAQETSRDEIYNALDEQIGVLRNAIAVVARASGDSAALRDLSFKLDDALGEFRGDLDALTDAQTRALESVREDLNTLNAKVFCLDELADDNAKLHEQLEGATRRIDELANTATANARTASVLSDLVERADDQDAKLEQLESTVKNRSGTWIDLAGNS